MGEIIKKNETPLTIGKEPLIIQPTESDKGKMDYFKTELERLKGLENTIANLNSKYIQAINEKSIYKTRYETELELNSQLLNELNLMKPYKTLLKLTCKCPTLHKEVNIFDCNRGHNNGFCKDTECYSRRILIEDIKNKYLE